MCAATIQSLLSQLLAGLQLMQKGWHHKETCSCSGLTRFSGTALPAHMLQQSDILGLIAHSPPFPDVSSLSKGSEVNCSVTLVGQCVGARLGEHFEGQIRAIIISTRP